MSHFFGTYNFYYQVSRASFKQLLYNCTVHPNESEINAMFHSHHYYEAVVLT